MHTRQTSCRMIALLVIALPALALAQRAQTSAPAKSRVSTPTRPAKSTSPALRDLTPLYVGAGGCAAAACHGEAATAKSSPTSKNAYSLWMVQRDPHSIAYSVLKTEASRRILWLLDGATPPPTDEQPKPWQNAAPHRDTRCLTCHSILPDAGATLPDSLLADGVSCEACHGPAASWRQSHTTTGWLARGPDRYQTIDNCDAAPAAIATKSNAATGDRMWNTRDMSSRANVCVRCHVGGSDRDVNHDLIAAGHPRLNFELAAFMANLPRHWDNSAEAPDHEIRLWSAGQLASSRARGSAARPARCAAESDAPTRALQPAWPELAEYDCFACHHDLSAPSWRQELAYTAGRRKPGTLPWGTWHFSRLQEDLWPTVLRNPSHPTAAIADVRARMATLAAKSEQVAPLANTLAKSLCGDSTIAATDWTSPKIVSAMIQISNSEKLDSWDEAAQRYLALVALANSHRRTAGGNEKQPPHADIQSRLEAIRKNLNFGPAYRSPAHFNRQTVATVREQFDDLREYLESLESSGKDRPCCTRIASRCCTPDSCLLLRDLDSSRSAPRWRTQSKRRPILPMPTQSPHRELQSSSPTPSPAGKTVTSAIASATAASPTTTRSSRSSSR